MHYSVFPDEIAYGSSGGPSFDNVIVQGDSRRVVVMQRSGVAQHVYDVGFGVRSDTHLTALKTFFLARKGSANAFPYKDWSDFRSSTSNAGASGPDWSVSTGDQLLGSGNGIQTQYQLIKTYTDGVSSYVRTIRLPKDGTVRVWVNGAELMSGWTVNLTTGLVTLASPPALGHPVRATFEFYVACRFGPGTDKLLQMTLEQFDDGSAHVELFEDLEFADAPSEYNFGGAAHKVISADYQVSPTIARLWTISASTGSLKVIVPNASTMQSGSNQLEINNVGSNTFTVYTVGGTLLGTLTAGQGLDLLIGYANDGVTKVWHAS